MGSLKEMFPSGHPFVEVTITDKATGDSVTVVGRLLRINTGALTPAGVYGNPLPGPVTISVAPELTTRLRMNDDLPDEWK